MPIAIREDLLSGNSLLEKFRHAQALGAAGVEFWSDGLTDAVPDVIDAIEQTGVQAAAIYLIPGMDFVSPDPAERERALAGLRQAIVDAHDIGAAGVIFVPHYGKPVMPDMSPWMSAPELEVEMLYMHLRTLSDYSYAIGVNLYIEAVNRSETHLLNRISQVARITRRLNHPNVKISADLYQMAREEADLPATLREHADGIGYIHLADSNGTLPGRGQTDFAAIAAALRDMDYTGWLSCWLYGIDGVDNPNSLSDSLAYLRRVGLS
jgi:sugar phosphate isomerase/epimerase